jgi:AAA+ ATPase superfamily predicted ATPase
MRKFFNIAGPCVPEKHYILDPFRGIGDDLMYLIDTEQYFLIHAARQSGKTTLLKELAQQINTEGKYYALYCSLEAIERLTDPKEGMPEIVRKIESYIKGYGLPAGFAKDADYDNFTNVLNTSFSDYCRLLDKPLVVLFDEADCLADDTLITFLKQLREGYISRPGIPFIHSVALVGMRNLRDYKDRIRSDSQTLGGASPFNIVTEYINLGNFTSRELSELYMQHTQETGQIFQTEAVEYAFNQTQGQPWLVNAIARECVEKICKRDYTVTIDKKMVEQAIQNIILARGTHFDSLMKKLREPRIRNVVEPLILGEEVADRLSEDYLYARDLGIIRDSKGEVEPANPIYAELIIRALNWNAQVFIQNAHKDYTVPRYIKDGKMDMSFLLREFQEYWRENSEMWKDRYKKDLYQYDEAATHLVLQAFLQRVLNGGGHIIREMALGSKRADLCVVYEGHKYPIELKILQNIRSRTKITEQILSYMDKVGENLGWLVIFDKDTEKSWDEKIYMREEDVDGKKVVLVGC